MIPIWSAMCHFISISCLHNHPHRFASPASRSVRSSCVQSFCYYFCDCIDNLLPFLQSWVVALPSAGESIPVHNINVELDVTRTCRKKRGEREADIARAIQISDMMIRTISKGVQETESKVLTRLSTRK
jgi:hypothetical protein